MSYEKDLIEMINSDIETLKSDIQNLLDERRENKYAEFQSGAFCPKCNSDDYKMVDTRIKLGHRVRSKKCKDCGYRWRTIEIVDWSL